MRRIVARLARELPPSVTAAVALAGFVALISALAVVSPPGTPSAGSTVGATAPPAPVSASAAPVPGPGPVALAIAPEAGGIVFRACCEQGQVRGIWRYDGPTGTVRWLGASGEPTADGRGYVVRTDDGRFVRVDAASGATAEIAPAGATAADAAPATSDLLGAHIRAGAVWVTPRSGAPWRVAATLRAHAVRISPDGRRLVLLVSDLAGPDRRIPTTALWTADLPDGDARLLARIDRGPTGSMLQLGPWSPDGAYLAYWESSLSSTRYADGAALRAIDVRSGERSELGRTLLGSWRLAWKPPHTLAYVSGGSRMTWDNKAVRIWSPETGATDVTASGVGLNPSWSADGTKLYLITADEHGYDPLAFFAGRESGDRRLAVYDLATKRLSTFAPVAPYVYEGARQSRDGALLVLWRAAYVARSVADLPPIAMTIALVDPSTGRATPLVGIPNDAGSAYYGSYEGPQGMAWSTGR